MTATFLTVNDEKFSLNGVEFFKIFIPVLAGNGVSVVNAYDSRRVLLTPTNFADFQVNGNTFANSTALINALNSVIFTRTISGGGTPGAGNYAGVSTDGNNALRNGVDGMPFLSEDRFNFESPEPTDPTVTAHGIVSFNSGYIDGLNFQPSAVWDFAGTRYSKTTAITLAAADPTFARIDVIAVNSAGNIVVIQGTPAENPEKPVINPDTQIEATFFIIDATATAPQGVSGTPIYNEFGTTAGGEWNATETTGGARINLLSGSQTKVGNNAVEASNLVLLDKVEFAPAAPLNITAIKELSFYIKAKKVYTKSLDPFRVMIEGTQNNGRPIVVWLTSAASHGFDPTNATDWQFISLPVSQTSKLVSLNKITFRNEVDTADAWGFFLDVIKYSDGTTTGDTPTTAGVTKDYVDTQDAAVLQAAKDYADGISGGGGTSGVTKRYLTFAALLADQVAQVDKGIYYAEDASGFSTVDSGFAYFEYLGTVNGNETDYRKLSEEESLDVEATGGEVYTLEEKNKLASITAIFTTALKSSYDSAASWISNNGTNILNHLTKWATPTAAGKMPRTLEGGGIEWIDTPSGGTTGGGDMVLASEQTVSGLKTFLNSTLGFRNAANTFTSFITNANTAARTYTLQNRNGTLADLTDINGKMNVPTGGSPNYLPKFLTATTLGLSRLWDNDIFFGIGTSLAPSMHVTLGNQENREIGIEESQNTAIGRDLSIKAGRTINYVPNTDFNSINQTVRGWYSIGTHINGSIYAGVFNGDIYVQPGGTGNFSSLGQPPRVYAGLAGSPNGNMYAIQRGGDIYMQTGGTGNFIALGQTSRNWEGIAAAANGDIYATVADGDIYKQTGGTGNFIALGQTARKWKGITVAPNGDIYAVVFSGGDIYKQTGGTGDFLPLLQTGRNWKAICAAPNGNIYASVGEGGGGSPGDIYLQTNGTGNFIALNQASRWWSGLTSDSKGNIYACVGGVGFIGDIYLQNNDVTGTANLDGGTLKQIAGTGKGTGKSRFEIYTGAKLPSGTDMQLETLRTYVDENGYLVHLFTPVYENNAAALAGGLPVGAFYRTAAGVSMIVY